MDFGDVITLILFLIFIGAPLLKRKKAQKPGKSKQSGFSVLGKISEAIREAAREMEAQAEQARKKEASRQNKPPFDRTGEASVNQTFWDKIDDRKEFDFYPEEPGVRVLKQIEAVNEKTLLVSAKKEPRRKAAKIPETRVSKASARNSSGHDATPARCHKSGPRRLPARVRGLRKAVIWSEILGKPVALKD
ncbi:hypothetical protein DespoDRAFT_00116 [Desulfobacter postgatei 2ac9]|uniref:Uncharacterized protein n=2 Tax=Desulfobacter postgatei TaxID=2293 RepID=I5AY49_9BACT|nr:hypothetical protein DespoDRAFT_00116 [Desulfobacter postgatei 2ac9]